MIQYNSQNTFKEIHYNGYDIKKVYGNNHLVWEKESPVPPTPSDSKYKFVLNDSSIVSAECDSTSAITSADTDSYYAAIASVEIYSCVATIETYAFSSCKNLQTVKISNSIREIDRGGFMNCRNLASITISATLPPTLGTSVFYNTNNCPIYVPAESVNTYKEADVWRSYASRIFPIPT